MRRILLVIIGVVIAGTVLGAYFYNESTENSSYTRPTIVVEQSPDVVIHETDEDLTLTEKQAILTVQNFKGDDNKGKTMVELLGEIITAKYPKSVITDASTQIGWSAFTDSKRPNSQSVVFTFNSTENAFSFLWYVDGKTGTILPVGKGAQDLMNLLQ